jgi:hypothetical protein
MAHAPALVRRSRHHPQRRFENDTEAERREPPVTRIVCSGIIEAVLWPWLLTLHYTETAES